MTAPTCNCPRRIKLRALLGLHAQNLAKTLDPNEDATSTIVSGTIVCPGCHTLYVISTIVVTVPAEPTPALAKEARRA